MSDYSLRIYITLILVSITQIYISSDKYRFVIVHLHLCMLLACVCVCTVRVCCVSQAEIMTMMTVAGPRGPEELNGDG